MIKPGQHPADFFLEHCQEDLDRILQGTKFDTFRDQLSARLHDVLEPERHGHWKRWIDGIRALPEMETTFSLASDHVSIGSESTLTKARQEKLRDPLMAFHPWRKGPWKYFGMEVDTEWQSSMKWNRLAPHLDLAGKNIIDIGGGNGYYGWKMLSGGARSVLGIDPSINFVLQFLLSKIYIRDIDTCTDDQKPESLTHAVLPFVGEDLPSNLLHFDMVFSMGVLYHRRSPVDHLTMLAELAKPGGQVILETLVIEGKEGEVLFPRDRYAMMRNVWFLPSIPELVKWMKRLGYWDVQVVDKSITTVEEQRSTDWMTFRSLHDFLDPADHLKTIEGYPAPLRATILARTPDIQ